MGPRINKSEQKVRKFVPPTILLSRTQTGSLTDRQTVQQVNAVTNASLTMAGKSQTTVVDKTKSQCEVTESSPN